MIYSLLNYELKTYMKGKALICLVLTSFCLTNCSKEPATVKKEPDVYVCGYANLTDAVYWKNGVMTTLGMAFNTTDMDVSGSDVYVAGNIGFALPAGGGANAAVYWKNGSMVRLGNDPSYVNSITVSGTDVYACGQALVNNEYVAVYWKNGMIQPLSNVPGSSANAITVSNNDVYVAGNAGQNNSMAVYWKNAAQIPLETGYANAIEVVGPDVYVAGGAGQNYPGAVYWKNGLKVNLNDPSVDTIVERTSATGIAIAGADIYVSGYVNNIFAVYWKNGIRDHLNNPATYMNISNNKNAIVVNGTDVYVSFNTADYWHNGKIVHAGNGYASAIVIKP